MVIKACSTFVDDLALVSRYVKSFWLANSWKIYHSVMRKQAFCICEHKAADQLCGNCAADQRLCFRYIDSKIPLLPKSEISSHWPYSVSDLVGKPEDRFSRDAAIISQHIQVLNLHYGYVFLELQIKQNIFQEYENHLLCA